MRKEVLSSVGAQDTDTRGYQLSDLGDIEFSWEDPAVDMDCVYRTGSDTPFSPSIFDDFQMISTAANPKIVDDEEDQENSAKTTTTPESKPPTEPPPPQITESRPFEPRLENVPDSEKRNLFR